MPPRATHRRDDADPPPLARFDSLDPRRGGRSFRFEGFRRAVVARAPAEVVPALRAVEEAVGAGLHAAGYLAYEAAPALEARFAVHPAPPALPLAWFGIFARRAEVAPELPRAGEPGAALGPLEPSTPEGAYRAAVERILEWIAAGDCYQVNHTFRLRAPFHGSEEALYARLCAGQRAAYCAHLRLPRFSVLSASPELFFRWSGGELEMRPMKGTRPRGRWPAEDEAEAAELAASAKDRAENLMIVDLLRNDAGRVAEFGSVRVPELFRVERYPTVHQMTSTVRARTRPGTTLLDVVRALFPSGSVTGAPKIRSSEIIAALEDSPRGVYTGAVGFASPGECVFNVAIRTAVLDREAGTLELGIGSGITADSRPGAEYRECLSKAAFARRAPPEFRLLESLRHEHGAGYPLLEEHLARLVGSARYFDFALDPEGAREVLLRAGEALGPGVHKVRLLVDRDGRAEVESHPIPAAAPPARVALAPEPVDARNPLLFHKTTRRELYRARAAARPDCDDVLLLNREGELTEATTANLVVRLDGAEWTPPLAAGLLPGVLRGALLRQGRIRERRLTPEDLHRAEAVHLINAVRGWRRAVVVP